MVMERALGWRLLSRRVLGLTMVRGGQLGWISAAFLREMVLCLSLAFDVLLFAWTMLPLVTRGGHMLRAVVLEDQSRPLTELVGYKTDKPEQL